MAGDSIPAFEGAFAGSAPPPEEPFSLWYRSPAAQWVEALAVGNGRLGAMVFGGIEEEHLQLNEDTLWTGGPYDPANSEALPALPRVRELIFAGKYQEAHALIAEHMMAKPLWQAAYQPLASLVLGFPRVDAVEDYRRELDLDTAICRVRYRARGVRFEREVFASPCDQVLVVRLWADEPRGISLSATFRSPQTTTIVSQGDDALLLAGTNAAAPSGPGALGFHARVRLLAAGARTSSVDGVLRVEGADSAILLVTAATGYRNFADVSGDSEELTLQQLSAAAGKSYRRLREAHIAEHRRLFRRVRLDLGATPAMERPTDERVRNFALADDPQLAALYFQFGRYLLISCSRPGTQPANLQGLWNDLMQPPWGSKYTININTQMNYWPAEPTNLAECHEPLLRMVSELAETGARTARVQYGARGWVAHHNTDLWRATAAIDGPTWGMWPTGGAWLALHLWEHYSFNEDLEFLAEAYPVLKSAAEFFLDTLVEEPGHEWLVTAPSLSPENEHLFGTSICAGPTIDSQIVRDLFDACERSAQLLNLDPDFRRELVTARGKLPPNRVGAGGQLMEWLDDWDLSAKEPHHRHVSHLYGLYPSAQIGWRRTPELAAAAKRSLEMRGDDATGWGLGWRLNLWARLGDAEHAYHILTLLLHPSRTYPNLFDAHPPFQIDGNFGATAGIAEMLLQSQDGVIDLLPALPAAWPTGAVEGLRARGGFQLDLCWKDGQLVSVTIESARGGCCTLRYHEALLPVTLGPGVAETLGPSHWELARR